MPWVSCGVTTARAILVTFVGLGWPFLTSSGVFQVPSQQTTKRFFAMTFLLDVPREQHDTQHPAGIPHSYLVSRWPSDGMMYRGRTTHAAH
jgi:hypothetical protein